MKILVAEDDAMSRMILQKSLQKLGHETVVAVDGVEALALYRDISVDAIISDWMMPGMDGLELCQRVRATADRPYTYFILLTSLAEKEHFVAGMTAGADDYLIKPLDIDDLRARLISAERVTSLHRQLMVQAAELENLNEQLTREVEIAREIQTALLPRDLSIDRYALALEMVPATQVGGDLIDYMPQPDGQFWLAVGDVTGHGLTPGLVMMMAQTIFTTLVNETPHASPAHLLASLNRTLYRNVQGRLRNDNYMTLQLIRHLGDGRFLAAGGHLDLLIYRAASGLVERMEVPGAWTGLFPEIEDMLDDHAFTVEPDDVLLLYTDGLIEATDRDYQPYDMDRLQAALARNASRPVDEIKAAILAEVFDWLNVQDDDISLIVLRRSRVALGPGSKARDEAWLSR